ncbi:hypothetical protein SNE510_28920 [Streptomyces sp. NE5-10]|nr:hypothetical protein SNE510_28920 [Streptomyces sp. NE5-10]
MVGARRTLLAGALADERAAPLRSPWVVTLVVSVIGRVGVAVTPETAASLRPAGEVLSGVVALLALVVLLSLVRGRGPGRPDASSSSPRPDRHRTNAPVRPPSPAEPFPSTSLGEVARGPHSGTCSGGWSSTRGLYSTSWMRPSKVRCSIISRATSG